MRYRVWRVTMTRLLIAAAAALLATATFGHAATYKVDGLINSSAGGFGSSLIHEQDYDNDMSGSQVLNKFDEAVDAGGYWNHDGSIGFSGTWNSYGYDAVGNIDQSNATGSLTFNFESGAIFDTLTFYFAALDMNGLPNSFKDGVLNLWGGTNTCSGGDDCYGIDLRVGMSPVPLPAPALMLLAGIAALGGLRARKTRTA